MNHIKKVQEYSCVGMQAKSRYVDFTLCFLHGILIT